MACIESYVSSESDSAGQKPCLEFYETTELCGQFGNWVGPNIPCLVSFCRSAGFARVSLESVLGNRAHVTCFRNWETGPGAGPEPYIVCIENSVSRDHAFSTSADDYLSIWFKSVYSSLGADDVFPEIGGYAVRPVLVQSVSADGWQAIVKLPPGIQAGWQEVRMRLRDSAYSNLLRIGVDVSDQDRAERSKPIGKWNITDRNCFGRRHLGKKPGSAQARCEHLALGARNAW